MSRIPTTASTAKMIDAGDSVIVEPKNPLKSTALWGLFIVGLNLGIQKLIASGKLPAGLADLVGNAAVEVVLYVIAVAMILIGRWRATRPLGFGDAKVTTVKCLLPILMLLSFASGCTLTPAQKIYLARQSYIGTEQAVTKLIRGDVIKAGPTLAAVVAARDEAREALIAADAAVGTIGFDFVMSRVESALGRLAQFYLDHRTQPDDAPGEPGAYLWTPSRSSPAYPRSHRSFSGLGKHSPSCEAGRTSLPRSRMHYVQCRALRTPTLTTL